MLAVTLPWNIKRGEMTLFDSKWLTDDVVHIAINRAEVESRRADRVAGRVDFGPDPTRYVSTAV